MSVEFYRGSPGKFDSRTLSRELLVGGPGVVGDFLVKSPYISIYLSIYIYIYIHIFFIYIHTAYQNNLVSKICFI